MSQRNRSGVWHRDCECRRTDSTHWVLLHSAQDVVLSKAPRLQGMAIQHPPHGYLPSPPLDVLNRLARCRCTLCLAEERVPWTGTAFVSAPGRLRRMCLSVPAQVKGGTLLRARRKRSVQYGGPAESVTHSKRGDERTGGCTCALRIRPQMAQFRADSASATIGKPCLRHAID